MYDVILVGGGLANCLIAWRLRQLRPDVTLLLLEQGDRLGGNHTWSFYDADLPRVLYDWLQPAIAAQWPSYTVRFPQLSRALPLGYNSVTSERLHAVVTHVLGDAVRLHATVTEVSADAVVVDGRRCDGRLILDGRGFKPSAAMRYAYQKFVGLEVELEQPHGLSAPVIMDATVVQTDGFRFLYTLPFTATRLLIEDTRYSDTADIARAELTADIKAYARDQGWRIKQVRRTEQGVLPITLSGDIQAFWRDVDRRAAVPVGMRAGLFHATTGYSLPWAAQTADRIARHPDLTSSAIHAMIATHATDVWRSQRFYRMLNRMLFYASRPERRYTLLARFYRFPAALIARFYAGRSTGMDKLRIMSGKPPVSILRAIRALLNTGVS